MKIFHISDLHIGKQLNYYSLKENQKDMFHQIIQMMREHKPDVLIIAGDIFDKSMPSGESYTLFDAFLNDVSELKPAVPVCLIAGNHDSPERLNYASTFLERHQIYISVMPPQKEEEHLKKIVFEDEFGPVNIYLLPFTKPGYVRHLFKDQDIPDYETAVRLLIEREELDRSQRNVIVSHQFYQSQGWETATCDSEQVLLSVGGLDRIDISVLKDFDYAALGHLHGPQKIKENHIRYSGSPLKYSVSEEKHKKSVSMITFGEKGKEAVIELLPLCPMQDIRRVRGSLEDILGSDQGEKVQDFVSVTVTDEAEPYRMKEQLREKYEYLLEIRVDNARTRERLSFSEEEMKKMTPFEAFVSFYEDMNKVPLSDEEEKLMSKVFDELMEETQ